jgi:hypothetical protein
MQLESFNWPTVWADPMNFRFHAAPSGRLSEELQLLEVIRQHSLETHKEDERLRMPQSQSQLQQSQLPLRSQRISSSPQIAASLPAVLGLDAIAPRPQLPPLAATGHGDRDAGEDDDSQDERQWQQQWPQPQHQQLQQPPQRQPQPPQPPQQRFNGRLSTKAFRAIYAAADNGAARAETVGPGSDPATAAAGPGAERARALPSEIL